ncbi:type II toxin-antitoxin system toxin TscT [Staphylococcus hominis]|uniref:type II toxin-antitoxin system toxin TscT n=1 Tax=Staphylococcus hominis TaxID=1290 RepID=UPI00287AA755|nr:DUF1474 family protein [Staphylococcus hominis]MDS3925268.1 DUF1474 family protein [Staphylococcus hominis]
MNWETRNLIDEFELVKEKYQDLLQSQAWFIEDYLIHESSHKLTKDEVIMHGMKYHEHRINIKQFDELLRVYTKELSDIIEQFKKIDKKETLSVTSDQTETDNANKYT